MIIAEITLAAFALMIFLNLIAKRESAKAMKFYVDVFPESERYHHMHGYVCYCRPAVDERGLRILHKPLGCSRD